MKHLLQTTLFNALAIAGVAYIAPGVTYDTLTTLLLTAITLALVNAILRPFLKLLLLPINIITLGLMGWLTNVLILYIVDLLITNFSIDPFSLTLGGTELVLSQFWAYVVVSFLLNIASTLINWLLK